MSSLQVQINNKIIFDGDVIPLKDTKNFPKISFSKKEGEYYTIIIVDPDAPSRNNPVNKYFLHMLIINNTDEIVKYTPPDPPKGSGKHRYFIFLLKQNGVMDKNYLKINIFGRAKFNLGEFIADNHLEIIDSVYFLTESR
uniref:Phosphatidylethanolamine-binding protein-like protein n=1 Tax=Borely moumouvirus TaxID=2712067 RepID=A0A6G6ADQ5_9VIRU